MTPPARRVGRDGCGLAGIEFALVAPLLLLLLGGLADFGLAFCNKQMLAGSVAQGARYAALVGPSVSGSAVQGIVQQKLSLPATDVTVTGPSCYCVSGTPAKATAQTCATTCPNGAAPGTYLSISARYTYTGLFPFYSKLVTPVLTETAMVRLR